MSAGRVVLAVVAALAGCAAAPFYAQFEPLPAAARGERVAKANYSIVLPDGWQQRDASTADLDAFEAPPDNGQYKLYRKLAVNAADGVAVADDELLARGLAVLRQRRARDELQELASGRVELADRECAFLRGRIRGPAAGWFFETLDYFVPGQPQSLVVACAVPDGQMAASQAGFAALAATLQTSLAPPRDPRGPLRWFDRDRIALRLPEAWQPQRGGDGALATLAPAGVDGACELSTTSAASVDLGGVGDIWLREHAAEWRDLHLLMRERTRIGDRDVLRIRAAYRGDRGTVIVDDTWAFAAGRFDQLHFGMARGDYVRRRSEVDGAVASLRWR